MSHDTFSATLTTGAFDPSRLRWFATCSCKPAAREGPNHFFFISLISYAACCGALTSLDLPPEPDTVSSKALALDLGKVPAPAPIDDDAPVIGIIDSGVNSHPLIADILVGAIGVPSRLGYADVWGHGTRVAGVAALGDLRQQLPSGMLVRGARLCSAKVTTDQGQFDERALLPSQMREAITSLHRSFGCRIFVIALGDVQQPYRGGKVGAWAATLDELARELNVLICVAAENRTPRSGNEREEAVTEYPQFLTEPENGFFEPAGAVNVLTVGSLAHGAGIDGEMGKDPRVRAVTRARERSPFTRVGPGVGGAVKPDVVDYGGTLVFDAVRTSLRTGRSEDLPRAGLLTLHHRPTERGTSARYCRGQSCARKGPCRWPAPSSSETSANTEIDTTWSSAARAAGLQICPNRGNGSQWSSSSHMRRRFSCMTESGSERAPNPAWSACSQAELNRLMDVRSAGQVPDRAWAIPMGSCQRRYLWSPSRHVTFVTCSFRRRRPRLAGAVAGGPLDVPHVDCDRWQLPSSSAVPSDPVTPLPGMHMSLTSRGQSALVPAWR